MVATWSFIAEECDVVETRLCILYMTQEEDQNVAFYLLNIINN